MPFSDSHSDASLDDRLRDVPVPEGLLERLRSVAAFDDAELDIHLRRVAVPFGLLDRLRRVPSGGLRPVRLTEVMLAASLLLAVGLTYVALGAGLLLLSFPSSEEQPRIAGRWLITQLPVEETQRSLEFQVASSSAGPLDSSQRAATVPHLNGPPVTLVSTFPGTSPFRELPPLSSDPLGPLSPAHLLLDATIYRWGVFGSHKPFDELPDLKKAPGLGRRGVEPPLVPGFDFAFFFRYGTHPFVFPAADPKLQTSVVPLDVDPASYELTLRYLEDGELPSPGAIRTEDFLAAVACPFPPPQKDALGLTVAGGPSPAGKVLRFFQVGVQARDLPVVERSPMHLTLAVDISASMRWGGRLKMIQKALRRLLDQLRPEDRVSLVAYNEYGNMLFEDLGRDKAEVFRSALDALAAEGATNIGAGLGQAYAVAHHRVEDSGKANRVVLLTDGRAELDGDAVGRIESLLTEAAARGITLDVIDLGAEQGDVGSDPQLIGFAKAGGGRARRAVNAEAVYWALQEILTGKEQWVATGARLQVAFNPKAVLAYRLLGHEARAMAGLMPAPCETNFHPGQSATALYEVRLKPDGEAQVAEATLTWRDPQTGKGHRIVKRMRREAFASSWVRAPMSLQAATVAAETAEWLRGSPFLKMRSRPASVAQIREMAEQVDSRLAANGPFQEMLRLLDHVEKAKPYRGRGPR